MQNNNTYSDILRSIVTVSDRDNFLDQLETVSKSFYSTRISASLFPLLRSEIEKSEDKLEYIDTLKKRLEELRILSLTLAYDPTYEFLQRISSWAKQNLGDDVILELKKDPNIVGGLMISFGGKFIDLSVSRRLNGYI